MIDAYLKPNFNNYEFIQVPDFAHIPKYQDGQKWRQYVVDTYGKLDCFVSGNPYVTELMKNDYPIIHPAKLIAQEKWIPLRATMVRMAMAAGEDYRQLVPKEVADYLEKNGLVERFRKEFGLKTIATLQEKEWISKESMLEEKLHTTTG
jgi:nicotinamide mononucleotide adenylyltransferase